jgi:hypothetical protein
MNNVTENFVIPELYGISIILKVGPGEIYSCASERGWWVRKKAIELIERKRPENASEDAIPPQSLVLEAIDLAIRYGQFWYNYKKCKSIYADEIMKEIT